MKQNLESIQNNNLGYQKCVFEPCGLLELKLSPIGLHEVSCKPTGMDGSFIM